MSEGQSIIWRRLDVPGHESTLVYNDSDEWFLDGAAVFLFEGKPCRLEYFVECDDEWRTLAATVDGWVGDDLIDHVIEVDEDGFWQLNGQRIGAVDGCIDIDLNFSPVTNLLPIKRLSIPVGESQTVSAAWLKFPSFTLEPLEQTYARTSEFGYRYRSTSGFETNITVNEFSLPLEYEGLWIAER